MNELISQEKMSILDSYAKSVLASGIVPSGLNTEAKVKVVLLSGWELGLSPMRALSQLYVVNGRCAQSAQNMTGMIRERVPTFVLKTLVSDERECRIEATRDGKNWEPFSFTMQEAALAQLTGKDNWKKFPADMLFARCAARMARRLFSDIIGGAAYLPDEIDASIAVGPDGNPISSYNGSGTTENARTAEITKGLESLQDVTPAAPADKIETLSKAEDASAQDMKVWANKKAAEAAENAKQRIKATTAKQNAKKTAPAKETVVEPIAEESFPAPEDLDQSTEIQASESEDYGNYKMPSGSNGPTPLTGKTLKELGREKVNELAVKTLAAVSKMKPSDIKQHTLDFLHAAEMWLDSQAHKLPGEP